VKTRNEITLDGIAMVKITYAEANGVQHTVDVESGISAMEGAVRNKVPGIDGDCGGQAACATCHVFVDPAWIERIGRADEEVEVPLLELGEGANEYSRLACQIFVTEEMEGLVLSMPEGQF
jgi:2Fe-2S ferredoxin